MQKVANNTQTDTPKTDIALKEDSIETLSHTSNLSQSSSSHSISPEKDSEEVQ